MKKFSILISLFISIGLIFIFWSPISRVLAQSGISFFERKPDLPAMFSEEKEDESGVDMEDLLTKRAEAFGNLRGLNNGEEVDPGARARAVEKMDRQQELLGFRPQSPEKSALLAAWSPIGPAPLAAGSARNSGRSISIAVHPTDANIIYAGTAQGGLYRSTDGGVSWIPLMDGAMSLAIGSIAISPSNPETIYIGTGEHNFSTDSFFGVGWPLKRTETCSSSPTRRLSTTTPLPKAGWDTRSPLANVASRRVAGAAASSGSLIQAGSGSSLAGRTRRNTGEDSGQDVRRSPS